MVKIWEKSILSWRSGYFFISLFRGRETLRTEIAAIFAICDCDARRGPQKSQRFPRQEKAMLHCAVRMRRKVASDLRFQAAISEPKNPIRTEKNSLKIKFLGGIFLGHHGPTGRDITDPGPGMSWTKTLCKAPFSVVLAREWPGCPAIWVGTSRDQKNFM